MQTNSIWQTLKQLTSKTKYVAPRPLALASPPLIMDWTCSTLIRTTTVASQNWYHAKCMHFAKMQLLSKCNIVISYEAVFRLPLAVYLSDWRLGSLARNRNLGPLLYMVLQNTVGIKFQLALGQSSHVYIVSRIIPPTMNLFPNACLRDSITTCIK